MTATLPRLQASILETTGFVEHEASAAADLLGALATDRAFELTIAPQDEMHDYPRMHVFWQVDGYVVMCFEDEKSIGLYPTTDANMGSPEVPIQLGGQALEKWPRQMFVTRSIAERAVNHFVRTGKQNTLLTWVANDAFPREVLWETRAQRLAWESSHQEES